MNFFYGGGSEISASSRDTTLSPDYLSANTNVLSLPIHADLVSTITNLACANGAYHVAVEVAVAISMSITIILITHVH